MESITLDRGRDMLEEKLNNYLKEALFYHNLSGLAVGITIGEGSPLKCKGFQFEEAVGFQNYIEKKALKVEHIFHVASITKLFVGTAILKLIEQGKLQLHWSVKEILPWFSVDDQRYANITILHLLTHTAGLADVLDYGWDRPEIDEGALKRYCESDEVKKSKLLWSPEENRFQYSNMGYELLGTVIAVISGMSFEDYVMEQLLRPLHLTDTTLLTYQRTEQIGICGAVSDGNYIKDSLDLKNLEKVNMAMPHTKNEQKQLVLEEQYPYNRAHGPSSTITTNLNDLGRWAKAHLEKRILREETVDLMWREYAVVPNNGEHIGLSWFLRNQNGYQLVGHEGNDDGFRASFWICPELDVHIAVLSNLTQAPVKKINKRLFDLLLSENNMEK